MCVCWGETVVISLKHLPAGKHLLPHKAASSSYLSSDSPNCFLQSLLLTSITPLSVLFPFLFHPLVNVWPCLHAWLSTVFQLYSSWRRRRQLPQLHRPLLTKAPLHYSPLKHLLKQWPLPTSCTSTFYYLAPWGSLLPWILLSWLQTITQMHRKWRRTEERTDKGF